MVSNVMVHVPTLSIINKRYTHQALSLSHRTKIDKDGGTDPRWEEVSGHEVQASALL